jgi:hypothetical protein
MHIWHSDLIFPYEIFNALSIKPEIRNTKHTYEQSLENEQHETEYRH